MANLRANILRPQPDSTLASPVSERAGDSISLPVQALRGHEMQRLLHGINEQLVDQWREHGNWTGRELTPAEAARNYQEQVAAGVTPTVQPARLDGRLTFGQIVRAMVRRRR